MNPLVPLVAVVLIALWCWQIRQQHILIMKLNELGAALEAVNTTLAKVQTEVQALKDSLANVDLPAAAQTALDKLVATAAALDALNDDLPATPPTP